MSKAKVYFYKNVKDLKNGYNTFFEMISKELQEESKTAIKIHFGAQNNDTHLNPRNLVDLPNYFKEPIFVESNCLYPGRRHISEEHIKLAHEHGFDFLDIDILDGELGRDYTEVEVNTDRTKTAKISTGLQRYKNLVSVAHFKGHPAAGFGGAIKNLAMGLGARAGKLDMHAGISPRVSEDDCTACGECADNCIADAITISDTAIIDQKLCIGCAYCISVCPEKAIRIPWGHRRGTDFLEKLVDYALAAVKGYNWWYVNGIVNITMKCDCMSIKQTPFMDNIGIVYSKDPVAIDQASLDLVALYNDNKNPFLSNNQSQEYTFEYAEKIGLGTRKYELIELD